MAPANVIWIGEGCGAGKSTLARRIAHRFDLRLYPVDAYTFAHQARADPREHPVMTAIGRMDFRARHGAERSAVRRAENRVVAAQLAAFHASLPDPSIAGARTFGYACECATLGCDAVVPLTLTEFQSGPGALADGHRAGSGRGTALPVAPVEGSHDGGADAVAPTPPIRVTRRDRPTSGPRAWCVLRVRW